MFCVYRYLNSENIVIYVGQTKRPIKQRVREHKEEDLCREMRRIEYIELPNETIMNQYEQYYINLYKPKYNNKSVYNGTPVPLPSYEWKLFYKFEKEDSITKYNLFLFQKVFDLFNNKYFKGLIHCDISLSNRGRNLVTLQDNVIYNDGDKYMFRIILSQDKVDTSPQDAVIELLTQMVLIQGIIDNVKLSSNRGIYKGKKFKKRAEKCGLVLEKCKYGFKPVDINNDAKEAIKDYAFKNCELYIKHGKYKKGNSLKYVDERTGAIVRGTKKHILWCGDECSKEIIIDIENRYGFKPMVLVD